MSKSNLTDQVRDMIGLNAKKGRRNYRELYEKAVADRVEESKELEESDAIVQRVKRQLSVWKKQIQHKEGQDD